MCCYEHATVRCLISLLQIIETRPLIMHVNQNLELKLKNVPLMNELYKHSEVIT